MTVRLECLLALVDELGLQTEAPVLDAGCGTGYLAAALTKRRYQTWGIDTSAAMLAETRRRLRREAPKADLGRYLLGSVEKLPYKDESFELVCSVGVIEYLEEDGSLLAETYRVLRPGGFLVLSVTNAWSPAGALDFLVEAAKRRPWIIGPFNGLWRRLGHDSVRPRHFRVRRHRPSHLRDSVKRAGFQNVRSNYFYMLPWPHPFDRLFPRATATLGAALEPLCKGFAGPLAEGYLLCARKPG